jgi:hypothetical protein
MTQRDIECTELEFASLIEMSGRLQEDRLLHRCIGRLAEVYPQLSPAPFAVVREAFSRIGWDSELTEVSEGGQCKVSGRQLQVRTTKCVWYSIQYSSYR